MSGDSTTSLFFRDLDARWLAHDEERRAFVIQTVGKKAGMSKRAHFCAPKFGTTDWIHRRTDGHAKKGQLNVAMESAFLTPAPSHATVDIRAAAAACGQATAASAVA